MKKILSIMFSVVYIFINAQNKTSEISEGISKIDFKTFELYTLKDNHGDRQMPNSLFYGSKHKDLVEKNSPKGSVDGSIHSFLVKIKGETILFDTDLGSSGRLWEHLKTLNVNSEKIGHIFLTHMHFDHIGGLIKEGKPTFEKAILYISKPEYEYWKKNGNSFVQQVFALYKNRLKIFSYQEEFLSVKPIEAHGHTEGHTAYQLGDLLIAGDFMHGLDLQKNHLEISASYDMNAEKAAESRKKLWDYAKKNRLTIAGMHLPKNGIYEFKK